MKESLKAKNIVFGYKGNIILDNLSFEILEGSIISILGSNSSGKTSLIKVLSGIKEARGTVTVDNVVLNRRTFRKYQLAIGVVLDEMKNKFLFDKVVEELQFPLVNLYSKKELIKRRILDISKTTNIAKLLYSRIDEITEYERLCLQIATSIIHNPKVLLIDDVFDDLTISEQKKIMRILKEINDNYKITIVYTTSNLELALQSERVILLNQGKIVLDEDIATIMDKDNELVKAGIVVPVMYDLSAKLKFYNLLDKPILDVGELVNVLWK